MPSLEDVRRITAIGDPILRNLEITQAYYEISAAMARMTGTGANWCTVATWASKQAGQSIRREDLAAAFERLLAESPQVQPQARALLQAGAAAGGPRAQSLRGAIEVLWSAINPAAAFERTSDAVARGNRKVFEEIGAEFVRFLFICDDGPPSEASLEAFLAGLRQGDPPIGQRYLRQAFAHYARAMRLESARERSEMLLLANLEIGYHEQTRLQPEIVEAMNAPVVEPKDLRRRLVAELFPDPTSLARFWLARLAGRMKELLQARDALAEETQRLARLVVTATLMTLTLPGGRVLRLGGDIPDRFPEALATIDDPELSAFLRQIDLTPNGPSGTRVEDWGELPQRMRFIANLFRTYHMTQALFDSPFTPDQVGAIRSGRRPAGPL
jgi:hypothetical protein